MKLRKLCFTLNNYTLNEYDSIRDHIERESSYGVVGKERGDAGTPHLQGYVEYANPRSFKALKEIYPRAHLEKKSRYSTNTQAAEYCKKELDFWEHGSMIPEAQGKRSDLAKISEDIGDDNGIKDLVDSRAITSHQHLCVAEKLMKYYEPERTWKPEVYWLFGASGTGKTRAAIEACEKPWISNDSLKWFCGYDGQEDVILDDFRADDCNFHFLLRILDRYPLRIPIKGGYRSWRPRRIFITTPKSITETYRHWLGEDIKQLHRRVDREIEYQEGKENEFLFGTKVA